MDKPRVTLAVVIAAYNYGRFLPETLDSTLAQDPPFDEIVVVDDGSTDDTREVLERYRDRVAVIECENGGQIAACLAGMRAASSDYVYLLDADDYLAPGMVATVRPMLRSRPAKVQFQLEAVDAEGRSLGSVFPAYPDGYDTEQMRQDNRTLGFYQCPPTSGNVVDRQRLLAVNLDPRARPPHIDATGILIQPYLGEVLWLPQRLAYYRVHGGNMFNTGWSNPSVSQLEKELEEFHDAWAEAMRVLDMPEPPYGDRAPLFVRERQLLIGALENRWWLVPEAVRYLAQLRRTHMPAYSKWLLAAWTAAFLLPVPRLRRLLVTQRRNPGQRSGLMRRVVRRRLGRTRPARGEAGVAAACESSSHTAAVQ